jgi:hypothetical protein
VWGVRWAAHRGTSGGVVAGRRGDGRKNSVVRRSGAGRRRDQRGEVWSAPGVLGVAFIGPGEGTGGVAGVTVAMNGY